MPRSKSSHRWLKEHFADPYVKRAQQEGYRSRATFKLIQIQERDHLFKPGMVVVDLGAAPGGWSQQVVKWIGKKGRLFALDILPMEALANVEFIQGDFREETVLQTLLNRMQGLKADVVLSDMAPNLSGVSGIDQPRVMYLAELALELVQKVLRSDGALLIKLFHGEEFDDFLRALRKQFTKVVVRKPDASRSRSAEIYLLATGYRSVIALET